MSDARRLTAWINAQLDDAEPQHADEAMTSVASGYAALCRQANERLGRCAEHLAHGLRSEAVHLAEIDPPLLDEVAALDLPRREAWDKVCIRHGLDRPPALNFAAVRQLNEAYAQEARLRPLLRRHRLLSLDRGPLPERIEILRSLASVDAGSTPWAQDAAMLETARLAEVQRELREAAARGEVDRLEALHAEITDPRLRVAVGRDLLNEAAEHLAKARFDRCVAELRELTPALHEAHSALDLDEAQALLGRWDQTLYQRQVAPASLPQDLRDAEQPVRRWVADQLERQAQRRAFEQACAELQRRIDEPGSVEDLERARQPLDRFDQPLPEPLAASYRRELGDRRLQRQRRTRTRLIAAAAIVALAATISGAVLWQQARDERAQQAAEAITQALETDRLETAHALWSDLAENDPGLTDRADLRRVRATIDRADEQEAIRSARFESLMNEIAQTPTPDLMGSTLRQAEDLARGSAEALRVAEHRSRFDQHQRRLQQQTDERLLAELEALRQRLEAIDPARADREPEALAAELDAMRLELEEALATPNRSELPEQAAEPIEIRLRALRQAVDRELAAREAIREQDRVIAGWGAVLDQPRRLAQRMEAFAQRYPDAPRSLELAEAASRAGSWEAVTDWVARVRGFGAELTPQSMEAAAERVASARAHLAGFPGSPLAEALSRYAAYWERGMDAAAPDGPWRGELRTLLNAPVVANLNMVVTPNGQRYYVVGDGRFRQTSLGINVEVLRSADLDSRTDLRFEPGAISAPQPAPQVTMSRELLGALERFTVAQWDVFPLEAAGMIRAAQQVDPVLRAVLMTRVLKLYREHQFGELPGLDAAIAALERHDPEQVNWLAYQSASAAAKSQAIHQALGDLPPLDQLVEAARNRRAAIHDAVAFEPVAYGLALRDAQGQWRVMTASSAPPLPPGGTLHAVRAAEGFDAPRLVRVGRVGSDGEPEPSGAALSVFPEGTLVFITR